MSALMWQDTIIPTPGVLLTADLRGAVSLSRACLIDPSSQVLFPNLFARH